MKKKYEWKSLYSKENGPYVPVASSVFPLKTLALKKLDEIKKDDIFKKNNILIKNNSKDKLIITSALCFSAVYEIIKKNNIYIDILKLGFTYPIDEKFISDIIKNYKEIFIIEELDRVLEYEIKSIAFDNLINIKIHSRQKIEDLMGELDIYRIKKILSEKWSLFEIKDKNFTIKSFPRYPQLCPGCGHRSAFFAIKRAIDKDDITIADIGCHTLGYLPPYNMGEVLLSMGHSISTASGIAINNNRKVIAFMGDSTFFHAGIPSAINSSILNSNIILILLENGTTAMTGHQPRIGSGEFGEKIDLINFFTNIGVKFVKYVDAYNQSKLIEYIKEAKKYNGFSVIIASHPCMLKFTKEMKKKNPDYKPKKVFIDENKCSLKKVCISEFGCPSFNIENEKVFVNEDLCIGDGSCIQTCPDKAIKPKGG